MSRKKITKEELITIMQEWAYMHGESPSQSQWDADPGTPSSNPVRQCFGSWAKGLQAAGLAVKKPEFSAKAREASRLAHTGARSSAWKGGRLIDKRTGYVMVWKPGHPNAGIGRGKQYVLEHRFVMAEHIGRPLLRSEQVHHKNGNRADNRLENLELWSVSQPSGQRVEDKLEWAKEFIALHQKKGRG